VDGEHAYGVAVGSSGPNSGSEIYVAGRTNGMLAQPAQGTDAFLRKYAPNGDVIWTRQFGAPNAGQGSADYANAVAATTGGEIYVVGEVQGTFPGETKVGGLFDSFVTRFSSDGLQSWTRQFGTAFEDGAYGIAVDSTAELPVIYVVGFASGPLPGQTAIGLADSYVRRYDIDGFETGTLQFGNNANDQAYSAASDATGVYVAGYINANPFNDAYVGRIPPPPDVNPVGVVNNASFTPHPAPVAAGSIAAVFGTNLNDGSSVFFSDFDDNTGKLVTSLGGTSATVDGTPAPIFYSTSGQIGVQIPFEVAGQPSSSIVVTVAGQSSVPRIFNLSPSAPGIFAANQAGTGIAAVLHQDGITPVTEQDPAHPGEVLVFFATGLGALAPVLETGAPSIGNQTVTPVTATVDGVQATVQFSGAAPFFVGLNQVNLEIPAGTRTAANIPVVFSIGGQQSNEVTIPVAP
jgi:uncharacterized protein (TIGR03437 family)